MKSPVQMPFVPTEQADALAPARTAVSVAARLFLGSCVLVALVIRWTLARQSGIWCDEGLFLFIVRLPSVGAMLHFLHYHEAHPPLFYLLMRVWLGVFGDTEAAALALPVGIGAILPLVAYGTARRMFSHPAGLIAALLTALAPGLASYSAEARPYSLLPLLGLASVYFLWDGLLHRSKRAWIGHVLATSALLYTHHWAWLVYGAEWALVGLLFWRRYLPVSILRPWLVAHAAILLLYAPWMPAFFYQIRHGGHDSLGLSLGLYSFRDFAQATLGLSSKPILLLLLLLLAIGVRTAYRKRTTDDQQIALLLCLGAPLIAFGIALSLALLHKANLLFMYCYMSITPCVLLAVSYSLTSLANRTKTPSKALWLPAVMTTLLVGLYLRALMPPPYFMRSNARELARLMEAQARPDDLIVVVPEWIASSFNYYFAPQNEQIDYPHQTREGTMFCDDIRARTSDPATYRLTKARLAAARQAGRRIWLITSVGRDTPSVSEAEVLPPMNYEHAGFARAKQLSYYLSLLYGPPHQIAVSLPGRIVWENLSALLFAPEGRSLSFR